MRLGRMNSVTCWSTAGAWDGRAAGQTRHQDGIGIRLPAHCAHGIGGAEKSRHELVHQASINLFRSSERLKGASVNERKPVSQRKRLILFMSYENGGDAGKALNPLEISRASFHAAFCQAH